MNLTFWDIKKKDENFKEELEKKHDIKGLNADVLASRKDFFSLQNLNFENMFFQKEIESYKNLKDSEKAANRILLSIKKNEKIAVFADYDCDGICSCAILERFFEKFKLNVIYHIPERNEGYGLNFKVIDSFKEQGVSLILTVDNGIVAFEEANYINSLGMDLIITDHHNQQKNLPEAFSIVNPKRVDDLTKFKEISGAVVVFKLIAAIEKKSCEEILSQYCDLLLISTIGDVMPLVCENKFIVEKGLEKIRKNPCIGLKKLLELLFEDFGEISSIDIAFFVCPKLNAAGRLNKANISFRLLVEKNEDLAEKLAKEILDCNFKRKKIEGQMLKEAISSVLEQQKEKEFKILIVYKENWLCGLTGIIAARLVEKFKKPAIVLSLEDGILVGSARSFDGFSIYDALKSCSDLFTRWGGHDFAGGLTLREENLEKFKEKIYKYSKNIKTPILKIAVDCKIDPKSIDLISVKNLKKIGPFGHGNKEPIFLIDGAVLEKIVPIGEEKHLKLFFSLNGFLFSALFFNFPVRRFYFKVGSRFKILVNLSVNRFRGVEDICYKILDMRPFDLDQDSLVLQFYEFSNLLFDEAKVLKKTKDVSSPEKGDYVYVYKILKKFKIFNGDVYDLYLLVFRKISFFKLSVILKVFETIGILKKEKESLIFVDIKRKIDLKEQLFLKILERSF